MPNVPSRIVVITNGNAFARCILEPLFAARSAEIVLTLIVGGDYKGRTGFNAVHQLARVTTLPYLLYKLALVAALGIGRRLRRGAGGVEELARRHSIPLCEVTRVADPRAIEAVAEARPDLIVSVSCPQLIPRRVLDCAPRGGINIHSSLLPRYAGLAPYFWVLAEEERVTGTTVHVMTDRFDDGSVLAAREVPIEPRESAFALFRRLCEADAEILPDAVARALDGDGGTPMEAAKRTYRSHPTFAAYRALRRRGHRLVGIGELWHAIIE